MMFLLYDVHNLLINTSLYVVAITNNEVAKAADIPTQNVVVRFSEA